MDIYSILQLKKLFWVSFLRQRGQTFYGKPVLKARKDRKLRDMFRDSSFYMNLKKEIVLDFCKVMPTRTSFIFDKSKFSVTVVSLWLNESKCVSGTDNSLTSSGILFRVSSFIFNTCNVLFLSDTFSKGEVIPMCSPCS